MRYRYAGIALVALLGLTGAARALLVNHKPHTLQRGPFTLPNPAAIPPHRSLVGSVSHVLSRAAPERLVLDTVFPDRPTRLLWLAGRPAAPLEEGAVTTDGTGGVVHVDGRLRAHWVSIEAGGREIISVAPATDGGWWLASGAGEILRADKSGGLLAFARDSAGRPSNAARVPFQYPELAASAGDNGIWVGRSPDRFGFGWHPGGAPPALLRLGGDGVVADSIGPAVVPAHALLTDLANTGRLVTAGDTLWYTPFIRDEILAFGPRGDTLWVASRGLSWAAHPTRFELLAGKPVIDYAPVNLGAAMGLDGRLYVLTAGDSLTTFSRLDVFDRTSGMLLRSADLETTAPTLASDEEGRVYVLDASRLLTGVALRERPEFPAFDLERLGGGQMTLEQLRGKVTLVNFWASWCTPCRTEMPALDSLRRSITNPGFAFLTINEDVREADAREFIADFGFDFPVLFGRGKMQERYHYLGLPYTVLLDREGRIVQRWFGYSGPEQIDAIRGVIGAELNRPPGATGR